MTIINGIVNPNVPVIAEELNGDLFFFSNGQITGKIFNGTGVGIATEPPMTGGWPALVPAPDMSLYDYIGDGNPSDFVQVTPNDAVLRADGTWKVPQIVATTAMGGLYVNPPAASPNGITQVYSQAGIQKMYTMYLNIGVGQTQQTARFTVPMYPDYPANSGGTNAGGLLPVASGFVGRDDAYFAASGRWRALPSTTAVPIFAGSATGTVPVATAADAAKVLSGAGTWVSHPITVPIPIFAGSATGTVPVATAADSAKVLSGAGTWVTPAVVPIFAGSATGTVPVATAADATKVLSGAGTWVTPTVPFSHWTSTVAAANTLGVPNGTTDLTEKLRRDGSVGLLTDPLTTFSNGGSYSLFSRQIGTNGGSEVITPTDSIIVVNTGSSFTQEIVFPTAGLWPDRILTVRMPVNMTGRKVTIKSATGTEITHPSVSGDISAFASIVMNDKAVCSATWQSSNGVWRLIDWTERAFYATADYAVPTFGVTSFNSTGNVATPAGSPYLIPAGSTVWGAFDGNYTPLVQLPATNNATGRFSVYANNSGSFPTTVSPVNTDLPTEILVRGYTQSLHFEWSNGLWHWVPAPEAAKSATEYSYPDPNPKPTTGVVTPLTNVPVSSGNIVQGTKYFETLDGNWVSPIVLPVVTSASVPITIRRASGVGVTISSANTTMPKDLALASDHVGRFVPVGDGLWHWIDGEINSSEKSYIIVEKYKSVGADYTIPNPVLTTTPAGDTYTIETLIEVTSLSKKVTLPVLPATDQFIGVEFDIKASGTWVGNTTIVAATGTIDGAPNYIMAKTATTQPSTSIRWTGSKWLII
jgi:hypothetical protein